MPRWCLHPWVRFATLTLMCCFHTSSANTYTEQRHNCSLPAGCLHALL